MSTLIERQLRIVGHSEVEAGDTALCSPVSLASGAKPPPRIRATVNLSLTSSYKSATEEVEVHAETLAAIDRGIKAAGEGRGTPRRDAGNDPQVDFQV